MVRALVELLVSSVVGLPEKCDLCIAAVVIVVGVLLLQLRLRIRWLLKVRIFGVSSVSGYVAEGAFESAHAMEPDLGNVGEISWLCIGLFGFKRSDSFYFV